MSLLRIYDPWELDQDGIPLDFGQCRTCQGTGEQEMQDARPWAAPCGRCVGHGSLKAAALFGRLEVAWGHGPVRVGSPAAAKMLADVGRCEGCNHPMGEGTWVGESHFNTIDRPESWAIAHLRAGDEPPRRICDLEVRTHFSPCDEDCHHSGPGRAPRFGEMAEYNALITNVGTTPGFEASWRHVDVRTLGHPHDLRLERLGLLCPRCYVARVKDLRHG